MKVLVSKYWAMRKTKRSSECQTDVGVDRSKEEGKEEDPSL